jgi:hypothetical protein
VTALALATRSFTPLAFRPAVERWIVAGLTVLAIALWLVVIPLELVLYA